MLTKVGLIFFPSSAPFTFLLKDLIASRLELWLTVNVLSNTPQAVCDDGKSTQK